MTVPLFLPSLPLPTPNPKTSHPLTPSTPHSTLPTPRHPSTPNPSNSPLPQQPPPQTPKLPTTTPSPHTTLNALCESLAREGQIAQAISFAQQMIASDVRIKANTTSTLIDACVLRKDISGLQNVFDVVQVYGFGVWGVDGGEVVGEEEEEEEEEGGRKKGVLGWRGGLDKGRKFEVVVGFLFLGSVGLLVGDEVVEPILFGHGAYEASSVLMMGVLGFVVDRYLGEGVVGKVVEGGLGRLLSDDVGREVRVEAAEFLGAFVLGLPWVCFRGGVGDVVGFLREGEGRDGWKDRCLVWGLMGVAMELKIDGRLIECDWKFGEGLIRKLWGKVDGAVVDRRLKWGLREAERLLKANERVVEKLASALLNGLSAGECVLMLSESFR